MVGLDISDRSIKIAEITGRRHLSLRTICWAPLAATIMRRGVIQDIQGAVAALREAFTKCSPQPLEGNVIVASIPETQSFVRVLELPQMPDHEVDEAIQWAIKQHIPFDLDRVYLDWQPVSGGSEGRRSVLVGAVQREVVDPLLQVFDELGLKVAAFELEAQAIVRSILPRDAQDVRGVLIVDLGATSTNVIFFDQGVVRFTTSVQLGGDDLTQQLSHILHMEPGKAAEQKALVGVAGPGAGLAADQAAVAKAVREATLQLLSRVDRVVKEMQVQFAQEDRPVRAVMLSGGSANLPGISQLFAEVFPGLPIEMGNPFINLNTDVAQNPLTPADASHFVTALGLALRQVELA
jgi:type IV pilus assembly protein PilM